MAQMKGGRIKNLKGKSHSQQIQCNVSYIPVNLSVLLGCGCLDQLQSEMQPLFHALVSSLDQWKSWNFTVACSSVAAHLYGSSRNFSRTHFWATLGCNHTPETIHLLQPVSSWDCVSARPLVEYHYSDCYKYITEVQQLVLSQRLP